MGNALHTLRQHQRDDGVIAVAGDAIDFVTRPFQQTEHEGEQAQRGRNDRSGKPTDHPLAIFAQGQS
ncbi:hypothetical protein NRB_44340 [Novosphingobium sp. 11B]